MVQRWLCDCALAGSASHRARRTPQQLQYRPDAARRLPAPERASARRAWAGSTVRHGALIDVELRLARSDSAAGIANVCRTYLNAPAPQPRRQVSLTLSAHRNAANKVKL